MKRNWFCEMRGAGAVSSALVALVALLVAVPVALVAVPAFGPGARAASTYTVTNTSDGGAGSLRAAITSANGDPGSMIDFNIPGTGPHYIQPGGFNPLPDITAPVTIDGYSQPGASRATDGPPEAPAVIMIVLDGSLVGNINTAQGLDFQAGSDGSYVTGLCVQNWAESGIRLNNCGTLSQHSTVEGCYLGTAVDGTASAKNFHGIELQNSHYNVIGGTTAGARNIISGNAGNNGIAIANGSRFNRVVGNYVGTDATGTSPVPNANGVYFWSAHDNYVGGATPAERNVISGNTSAGVRIIGGGENNVDGNYIGTDVTGTSAVSDVTHPAQPIGISVGGDFAVIGASAGNLISANGINGINLSSGAGGVIVNNVIGLDAGGNGLGNGADGVYITSSDNSLGQSEQGNVISGNGANGVYIENGSGNRLCGNRIGTNADGTERRGNQLSGLLIKWGAGNFIGDTGAHEGNLISGNGGAGIAIERSDECQVRANRVGISLDETAAIPNGSDGVAIVQSNDCLIGGAPYHWHNVISGNSGSGVSMSDNSSRNRVDGNFIGDAVSLAAMPNAGSGIVVRGGCYRNDLAGNSIYSNGDLGIKLEGDGNHAIAAPALIHAAWLGGGTARVSGTAPADSLLEFSLVGPVPDPGGAGQGRQPLGTYDCPNAEFTIDVAGLSEGEVISAIATDLGADVGDTSQFANNLTVTDYPAPSVTYLQVNEATNTGPVYVDDLHGTGFLHGARAWLTRAGQSGIPATDVHVLASDRVSCTFDVTGAMVGSWDVRLENPDGKSGTLAGGFTVLAGVPVVTAVDPSHGRAGTEVKVTGDNFGLDQGPSRVTIGGVAAQVLSWSNTAIVVRAPAGGSGPVVVTTAAGKSNDDKTFTLEADPASKWYLAEGSTAWGFSTSISIMNPNDSEVPAEITYMDTRGKAQSGGSVLKRTRVALPPASQTVIDAGDDLRLAQDFSTTVESLNGKDIAVERMMTWKGENAIAGEAHSSIGVAAPARTWYLPEGSSAWGFETWTLVLNPGASDANVTFEYMIEGAGSVSKTHVVPGYSRATFSMAEDIGQGRDASIMVTGDRPVAAERSMYRNGRREGSCSVGALAPATRFFLAEGSTAWGFTNYVLLMNPNDAPALVDVTYQTPDGEVSGGRLQVPAKWRRTVRVNDVKEVENTDVSTSLSSNLPIVAERAMYWDTPTGEVCHCSIGVESSGAAFLLPDGRTGGGWETWTLVQNPNPGAATVRITYMTPTGKGNVTFTEEIPANTRRTYRMNDRVASGGASVLVESLDGGRPVMVERSIYRDSKSLGTDTIGVPLDRG